MADARITELTELTSVTNSDLIAVVDDPAGTPITKKATVGNIVSAPGLVLTTPQINDTSSDHQYVVAVSELTADRNVTLPLLTGDDEFVFKDHAQTLTGKTLTSPKVGTAIADTSGNEIIKTPATASAVNEVTITNSATGNAVEISATGDDTNIDLKLSAKGTGGIQDKNGDYLSPNNSIFRQALINGNFDVWQRGTSITANSTLSADRWKHYFTGTSITLTPDTDVPNTLSKYSLKGVYVTGGTNKDIYHFQRLEGIDASKFSGKQVTYSFWVKASAAAGTINIAQVYFEYPSAVDNWGTFENATGASYAFTPTDSWTKVTGTVTLPATSATGYSIVNGFSFNINMRASDNTTLTYSIAQVQLCAGDVALPFMPKSFEEELRACQRYLFRLEQSGETFLFPVVGLSTTLTKGAICIGVPLRTNNPAVETSAISSDNFYISTGTSNYSVTGISSGGITTDKKMITFQFVASGLTAGVIYWLIIKASGAYIQFNAEL